MSYKSWCISALTVTFIVIATLFGAIYVVDPIGMWGSPLYAGINNYKEKQGNFLDVCKPFELRNYKPEKIYIGTSRVYVGWYAEEYAYNLGASSLNLPDMQAYLHYAYKNHKPKKVYIGLDLFQFSKDSMTEQREGFSAERLQKLESGGLKTLDETMTVNMGMLEYLKPTIKASRSHKQDKPLFIRGYDTLRGDATEVESKTYYHYLHSFYKSYTDFAYDPAALICLQEILSEAEDNGIEVILFFNPVSIDLQALQHICGLEDEYAEIKRETAKLHPVYDFAWASPVALDRENNWLDGSHYHRTTGERMKDTMNNEFNDGICKLLLPETTDASLADEKAAYTIWENENANYISSLKQVVKKEMDDEVLKEYLGF